MYLLVRDVRLNRCFYVKAVIYVDGKLYYHCKNTFITQKNNNFVKVRDSSEKEWLENGKS